VQASWRFLNNDKVSIDKLFNPIFETLKTEIEKQCSRYVLAITD